MSISDLNEHLKSGVTHSCHCWSVRRNDGVIFGFTDHDLPLRFDGMEFLPDSGLSAKAISTTTGLSVNNTEAMGVLNADAVTEADIDAGRFDGAEVMMWLVQWDNVEAREVQFRGTIGEITREAGVYRAELRGLTERLNQEQGRAYLRSCSAILGDEACSVNNNDPAFAITADVVSVQDDQVISFDLGDSFHDRWFEAGAFTVVSGHAKGIVVSIKGDATVEGVRRITLWQPLRAKLMVGDRVKLLAGCDKRAETCREKFDNMLNFQGFPDIPGDDWLMSVPRSSDDADGGSRSR